MARWVDEWHGTGFKNATDISLAAEDAKVCGVGIVTGP